MNREDRVSLKDLEPPKPQPMFEERDLQGYSLVRAIQAAEANSRGLVGGGYGKPDGLEGEVHMEIKRQLGPVLGVGARGGFFIPTRLPLLSRGAHEVATASKGGELKFTEPGPFIELLFRRAMVRRLGATVIPDLRGDVFLPRKTATLTPEWQPESQTADTSSSNMTFDHVALTPKQISGTTSVSRKLLAQGTTRRTVAAIDRIVADDFSRAFGVEIDRVALNGSGTSNQPLGLLGTVGIGDVAGGANGATPTYDHAVDLEYELGVDSADDGRLAWLTTSQVRKRLRKAAGISASTGLPAWIGRELLGYPAATSQNVPSNLTKGTSTTVCSALIFGNWEELVLGEWGAVELVVDPFTNARRGDVIITAIAHVDVGVRHAASFAVMKDALP